MQILIGNLFILITMVLINLVESKIDQENLETFKSTLKDHGWEVTELEKSECDKDLTKDEIKQYRKSLKSEGGKVYYVSADPLPVNEAELKYAACIKEEKAIKKKETPHEEKGTTAIINSAQATKSLKDDVKNNYNETTAPVKDAEKATTNNQSTNKGTTISTTESNTKFTPISKEVNGTVAPEDKVDNLTKSRRDDYYQFSSIEYYEDEYHNSEPLCPDKVVVVELDIDELRTYDVECEKICQWWSLDAFGTNFL